MIFLILFHLISYIMSLDFYKNLINMAISDSNPHDEIERIISQASDEIKEQLTDYANKEKIVYMI